LAETKRLSGVKTNRARAIWQAHDDERRMGRQGLVDVNKNGVDDRLERASRAEALGRTFRTTDDRRVAQTRVIQQKSKLDEGPFEPVAPTNFFRCNT